MEQRTTAESASAAIWSWRAEAAGRPAGDAAGHARRRGVVQGLVGVAAGTVVFLVWRTPFAWVIAGIGATIALLALVSPLGAYAAVERGLQAFARGVGLVVTWVLMTLLYYLLFLPLGLLLRARGRLGITKGFDRRAPSYFKPASERPRDVASYQRQF